MLPDRSIKRTADLKLTLNNAQTKKATPAPGMEEEKNQKVSTLPKMLNLICMILIMLC